MKRNYFVCLFLVCSSISFSQWHSKLGIGVDSAKYTLDVNGDINISSGHNYLINGKPLTAGDTYWNSTNSGIFYKQGSVIIGDSFYIPFDSVKLYVRNTNRVQFDAGNYGTGQLRLLLQARNNQKAIINFADGAGDQDFITFDDGEFHIAENKSPVGIGTTKPSAQLDVFGDIKISDKNSGLILKSPDGKEWKITIDNNGNLTSTLNSTQLNGIEIINSKNVKIFPNPSDDLIEVNIDLSNGSIVYSEIYNMTGALVYLKLFKTSQFNINVSDFESGIYVIKLLDKDKKVFLTDKLIIN